MAILGFELDEISRLIALVEAGSLEELLIEEEDRSLRIRGPRPAQREAAPAMAASPEPVRAQPALPRPAVRQKAIRAASPAAEPAEDQIALVSPMVGVFYRAGKPGDPPLVEVGQRIMKDQPIGIIEAMKIFSEIPAEQGGIVVSVPAKDGQLVQAGTPLVILKKD